MTLVRQLTTAGFRPTSRYKLIKPWLSRHQNHNMYENLVKFILLKKKIVYLIK